MKRPQLNKPPLVTVCIVLLLPIILGACNAMPSVFKSGAGIGIFAVLAILVVVDYIIMKVRDK